ncbi:hypothetical protein V6N13_054056 [Hibiscus sabdariffa]
MASAADSALESSTTPLRFTGTGKKVSIPLGTPALLYSVTSFILAFVKIREAPTYIQCANQMYKIDELGTVMIPEPTHGAYRVKVIICHCAPGAGAGAGAGAGGAEAGAGEEQE